MMDALEKVSAPVRAKRKKAPARRTRPRGPIGRFVERVDRIDWRIKLQITVGFCLAAIIATYLLREKLLALGNWSYLGAFIINAISSASVILPAPGGAVIAIMAEDFNPVLIGIVAGLGGAIGSSTAYLVGIYNRGSISRTKGFPRLRRLMRRFGGIIIFTFALIIFLPGDFASILAGATQFSFRRYLLYNAIASMFKMTVVAWIGAGFVIRLEKTVTGWLSSLF